MASSSSSSVSTAHLFQTVATVLTKLCALNDTSDEAKFSCAECPPPKITLQAYFERLGKATRCGPECPVLMLIYLDRQQNALIHSGSVHRLALAALTLAEKFGQDSYLECKVYAEIGGIPKEELMLLESEFMQSVQHNLYVDGDLFARYDTELRKQTTRMLSKGLL